MNMVQNIFNYKSKEDLMCAIQNNSSKYLNQKEIDQLLWTSSSRNLKLNDILLVNKISEEVVLSHMRQFTMSVLSTEPDVFDKLSRSRSYQENVWKINDIVEKLASTKCQECTVYCSGMIGSELKSVLGRCEGAIFHNENNIYDFIKSMLNNVIKEDLFDILRNNLSRIDFVKKAEEITGLAYAH
ncbi:hypothetical protein [Vibrio parahaemolyticus]|uniref:hypothetical protein n=1 Tax=Vibrio parahaemolyticus TaxID=670 RepID=UPI003D7C39BF